MVLFERSCHQLIFERSCNFLRRVSHAFCERQSQTASRTGRALVSAVSIDPVALGYACTNCHNPNINGMDRCLRDPVRQNVHLGLMGETAHQPEAVLTEANETVVLTEADDNDTLETTSSIDISGEDSDDGDNSDAYDVGMHAPQELSSASPAMDCDLAADERVESWHVYEHPSNVDSDPNSGDWIMLGEGVTYTETRMHCT